MARPSGMCNDVPCYTAADIAEIDAELANAQAEKTDLEAQRTDIDNQISAKDITIQQLQMEKSDAQTNACPL